MSEKILAINTGSSSIKFKLYLMPAEEVLISGSAENIGADNSRIVYRTSTTSETSSMPLVNHTMAINQIINVLMDSGVVQEKNEIVGVGHRISHGGSYYSHAVAVTPEVEKRIDELKVLSPLHNPNGLAGIKVFQRFLPAAKEVVTFDNSFHHTIPPKAYMYALPYELYEKYNIRRYGFHAPSHQYVAEKARELFGDRQTHRMIICHLGNGSSASAILDGQSVNSSMGFTPLAGVVMGTRCGDIDPEIIPFLEEKLGVDSHEIRRLLNEDSGLKGLSGISNDERKLEQAASKGNQRAQLALDVFVHSVQQYIGAYATDLNGVDTLAFTAGIGEHSAYIRQQICESLTYLGVKVDPVKNKNNALSIETNDSKVKVAVIPTNEEIIIARDVMNVIHQ